VVTEAQRSRPVGPDSVYMTYSKYVAAAPRIDREPTARTCSACANRFAVRAHSSAFELHDFCALRGCCMVQNIRCSALNSGDCGCDLLATAMGRPLRPLGSMRRGTTRAPARGTQWLHAHAQPVAVVLMLK
jgi:hypothetical protein